MPIRRYSSRTEALDKDFLSKALDGATKYYRIAGYFRSSIFELVGEEIAKIPEVKIVCNSELDAIDFQVASGRSMAIKERWNQVDRACPRTGIFRKPGFRFFHSTPGLVGFPSFSRRI